MLQYLKIEKTIQLSFVSDGLKNIPLPIERVPDYGLKTRSLTLKFNFREPITTQLFVVLLSVFCFFCYYILN